MNNETEAPELGYLICKNGMFYRPDSCGYTSAKSEAGRYSLNMAIDITHPNGPDGPRDGMTYIHETEVPDTRADLSDAKDKRIAELEEEYSAFQSDVKKREVQFALKMGKLQAERDRQYEISDAKDKRIEELGKDLTLSVGFAKAAAERIDELEARNRELALDVMSSNSQAHDAYERQKELKAKLAKAVDGLRECEDEIDQCVWNEYPHDHPVQERYRQRGFAANPARATLAELKGTE